MERTEKSPARPPVASGSPPSRQVLNGPRGQLRTGQARTYNGKANPRVRKATTIAWPPRRAQIPNFSLHFRPPRGARGAKNRERGLTPRESRVEPHP
eukprot:scaffold2527_cov337-Prasinococcus_capsulatus_cf.AAC.13